MFPDEIIKQNFQHLQVMMTPIKEIKVCQVIPKMSCVLHLDLINNAYM